jgi:hypothetical protein
MLQVGMLAQIFPRHVLAFMARQGMDGRDTLATNGVASSFAQQQQHPQQQMVLTRGKSGSNAASGADTGGGGRSSRTMDSAHLRSSRFNGAYLPAAQTIGSLARSHQDVRACITGSEAREAHFGFVDMDRWRTSIIY